MTRSLYKGLQCSKSREEVEQSYGECNYEVDDAFVEVNPLLKNTYQPSYTVTLDGVDIINDWVSESVLRGPTGLYIDELDKIPVQEVKPKRCEFNDCGWCYYKGDESNDNNGHCNNSESCEVNGE